MHPIHFQYDFDARFQFAFYSNSGIQQQIAIRVQSATLKLKEMASLQAGSRGRVANQEKLHLERLKKEFQDAVQQFSFTQKKTADRMRSSFVKKPNKQPKTAAKVSPQWLLRCG